MFNIIIGGITAGLIMTIMTGPAFFSLIKTSIDKGFREGAYFAFGVFTSDCIFVLITLLGASLLTFAEEYRDLIAITGGLFIMLIGIRYLLKKPVINPSQEVQVQVIAKSKSTRYFLKGLLMNMLNPGMLFYWIGLVSYLGTNDNYTTFDIRLFIFCSMFTVLSTDLSKAYFASKVRHLFSERVILWMNRIVGITLMIFAVVIVVKTFWF